MSRKRTERRLVDVGEQLRTLQDEAAICEAQLTQVVDEADDARLRALVSETPFDRHDHQSARRSADTLVRRHRDVTAKIAALEVRMDELLEELMVQGD